jgi:hypothetical protein
LCGDFLLGNIFGLKWEDENVTDRFNILRIEESDLYTTEVWNLGGCDRIDR